MPGVHDPQVNIGGMSGFEPIRIPSFLFGFQSSLVDWALRKGKSAIFADCGLGKTPMQLVWADNVHRKTRKPVLILTPLAVGAQTVNEGRKFNIDCAQSRDGSIPSPITITNYQQLHKFRWEDFGGAVCDESSILKNFDGAIKDDVTQFMRKLPHRLLCTATAAPNDYIELGTSSEALGDLGYIDMLKMFFKANDDSYAQGGSGSGCAKRFSKAPFGGKFRFRGHAEREFWRWVCSWSRAIRKPSDMGFRDDDFILPPLTVIEHTVRAITPREGWLIDLPAISLEEQRAERRRTLNQRCEMAASLVSSTKQPAICWCHLNPEGKLLEKLIPDSVEVSGEDDDDFKEETFADFAAGKIRVLVTKPVIGGFGMNWAHCAHQTFFPSHSFEQYYQSVRRSWRFGQKNPVRIDVIASEGEAGVVRNLQRKADAADAMFSRLVELMGNELRIEQKNLNTKPEIKPSWL